MTSCGGGASPPTASLSTSSRPGGAGDPVVLLCHGFPESSHSWRHQMRPLADAGYHVLAPDQRGYGTSESPLRRRRLRDRRSGR
ncbi:MAG: alpha/beta fold hydrolase [Ilumatobacteraceae bacterium]